MTVLSELSKIAYIGSSSQTLYPIPFEYINTDDVKVSIYTSNNEFVDNWTYSIQYVIEGGNVKVLSGYNIDNTKKLLILRSVDLIQDNKYREGGDFPAKSTETSFDKLTMITQQLQETLDRCVKVEVLDNQTPEELLQTVYDKLDSATEIAGDAISAANQAQTAADNATAAVTSAEQTLVQTQAYVDSAKVDINNTKNTAINTINSTVTQAKADINTAVSNAESNISTIVSDAEGSITNIAVTEANKAIANAAQEATDTAKANVNSYVDGTVKPSLQTYVDQAQEDANSAATSMEQAALSATAASNYASNASADADNAAESAGLAANSATAAKVSETNAKASETSAAATKAEVEAIAELASFGNIGDIKYTSRTDVPNGGAWCNGALYTKAQFPDVYQMLVDGKLQSTTISAFDSSVSANGSCGFFGLDTANERFKVPMLKDVYLKAGQAGEMFGAESLPNISGSITWTNMFCNGVASQTGALAGTSNTVRRHNDGGSTSGGGIDFNASRSSSTYQDGAKVNPDHVTYRAYVVLYASAAEASEAQAAEFMTALDGKQDIATAVNYTNITNCITEIPQDIKLELNNGTLTLKAGSKVYVPNGFESDGTTPKFDVKIIGQDLTVTFDNTIQKGVIISPNNTMDHGNLADHFISSSTAPSISWGFWYDLTNNQIKWTNNGSTWISGYSLPICIATGTNGSVTSIDQVFNGFGYIGSTVFALPGVKGLIPNGRNEDGSLKNVEFITNSVLTHTDTGATSIYICLGIDKDFFNPYYEQESQPNTRGLWYNPKTNLLKRSTDNGVTWVNRREFYCAKYSTDSTGKITSLTPKTAFHAVDWNDRETVVGWGIPDYSAEVSAPSKNTVAQTDIYVKTDSPTSASGTIYINDVSVANGWEGFVCAYVPKGATFRVSGKNSKYYPLKGVN